MKTREYLKTFLILVLLVGVVYLALVTWTANSSGNDWFALFTDRDQVQEDVLENPDIDLRPLSVSVKNKTGRLSAVYDDAMVDLIYGKVKAVLQNAVTSAEHGVVVDEDTWLRAVQTAPSILCDYQCDMPMSTFSFWMGRGEQKTFEPYRVRYLCLAEIDGTVYLFGKDHAGESRFCFLTRVSEQELVENIDLMEPNGIMLAAEQEKSGQAELLLSGKTQIPLLTTRNPVATMDESKINEILKSLNFNPNTVSRHVEQDGTRIFVEDISTLKITTDGKLMYSDLREDAGFASGLVISAEETSLWSKVEAARELVSGLDRYSQSYGRIYPERVTESGGSVEVLFRREVSGIPVDCAENGYCAKVRIMGNRMTEVEFLLLEFLPSEISTSVLPAKLAAASLLDEDASLSLRYRLREDGAFAADWYLTH